MAVSQVQLFNSLCTPRAPPTAYSTLHSWSLNSLSYESFRVKGGLSYSPSRSSRVRALHRDKWERTEHYPLADDSTDNNQRNFAGTPYVPVYVMLPVGVIDMNCELVDPEGLKNQLRILNSVNVDGVMVDCGWVLDMKWAQIVTSFHECGGNVGDDVKHSTPSERVLRGRTAVEKEVGFDHQEAMMPSVPAPDGLLSLDEIRESRLTDPRLPVLPQMETLGSDTLGTRGRRCYLAASAVATSQPKTPEARTPAVHAMATGKYPRRRITGVTKLKKSCNIYEDLVQELLGQKSSLTRENEQLREVTQKMKENVMEEVAVQTNNIKNAQYDTRKMSKETEDRLAKFEIKQKEIQEELRSKLAQIEANSQIDLLNNMKEMIDKHLTARKSLVENSTNPLGITPVHISEFTSVLQEIQSPIYFAVKNSPYQAGASFPTDCPTTSELKPDEFCISNEVLDLNKSVEKEKFIQRLENIEEVIKSIETVESFYGFDAKELSLVPGLVIPPKFKVPDFEKYNGTTCPSYHITIWYNQLKRTQIRSWRDLAQAFLGQYKHMTDMAPDRTMLQNMNMKCNESFRQYSQRWKDVASQVHTPLTEKEFTTLFISTLKFPYVNHMIRVVSNNFSDIIISGEIIEMAIKNGKIRGSDNTKVKKEAGVNTMRSITPQLDQSQWPPNENWTYKEVPWINQTRIPNCSAKVPGLRKNEADITQKTPQIPISDFLKTSKARGNLRSLVNTTPVIAEMSIQNPLNNMRAFIRSEQSKKVIASRARKALKVFQESISDLYPHFVKGQYITPRLVKVSPRPYAHCYDQNSFCNFHLGVSGHSTGNYWSLLKEIETLVDKGVLTQEMIKKWGANKDKNLGPSTYPTIEE
ncbi:hypothetical protein F3Y22_tig00112528pilonHSYRG00063 [Hibiscus syriacus]|uniref:Retrotransposon gag domain-containing protein n=1 Tax=Hibiscus syriacus TaxID=106335 RepID=A0A6A2Y819_HIBSY|nr:hypothetical protein F3Y22_tig00112528pilonHSYRG00063 [Hibiscus syriacus]